VSDQKFPMFVFRVVRVIVDFAQWVRTDRHGLIEGDAMLAEVAGGFLGIPLEDETAHRARTLARS